MKIKSMTNCGGLRLSVAIIATLLGVGVCQAGSIKYNVDQTIGSGSVVGSITTDGNTGILQATDITSWNLQLNGVGASLDLTPANSQAYDFIYPTFGISNNVSASLTDLYYNFSGDAGLLVFQNVLFTGASYYCLSAVSGACYQGATAVPVLVFDSSTVTATETGNQIIGVAATPLPSTWMMLIAGFVGLGFFAYRGSKKNVAALAA